MASRMICRTLVSFSSKNRGLATATWPRCQQSIPADEALPEINEAELIERKRNKSRLNPRHYKKLHKMPNQLTEDEEQVFSLSYQRKLYGHYGASSGINPAKAWPSKEELELAKEWESLAYPLSIQEMISEAERLKKAEEDKIKKRQADIMQKVAKLEDWKREVREGLKKREREAREAKEKKERLMEEVRQIFGFRIDPKDERFKEALLQKEREEKRAAKEAKKIERQQRMMENLRKAAQESSSSSKETVNSSDGLHGTSVVENSLVPPQVETKE
ncbi:growth arrest and DNA damage-inducible proteins-interacting protein 1-like [Penaeus chinensis]|uniref:growth arrest and DNA damage-inducible proteins-interacting protein 1-like n=1 Tax=Penaeus chinensis TaxID=139456 RepID=UPI001FB6B740|nr:growth arrest and DNA damage-inducible proteins-interacting protein 1-like [Penaeus chinensis]